MKKFLIGTICLNIGLITSVSVPALEFKQTFANNIVADGVVDAKEWKAADYEADMGGPAVGAMYAMGRKNYPVNGHYYSGCFSFLLHNIELLNDSLDWEPNDADYNVFDIFSADDSDNPILTIWVFNEVDNADDSAPDWLTPAGLKTDFPDGLDDRGFLVYNYAEAEYRQWLPEDTSPADGGYDWDYYWGVHALGGFNNSAYENGLSLAISNNNALYEVIYRLGDATMCDSDSPRVVPIRRSIKDPDDDSITSPTKDYQDGPIDLPLPLLVTFTSPFTALTTNEGVKLNWEIAEADRSKIAAVHLWKAETVNGECPQDINQYNKTTAVKLENNPHTDYQGTNSYCYGLRIIEDNGEETWSITQAR